MNLKTSFLLPLFFSLCHAAAAPLQQANINKIISDVRVIDKSGAHPAKLQELIKDDRGVMTGIKSRTELLFEDLTLTRLGAETYFSFTPGTRDMLLERGAMLLHVPKGRGGARIRAAGITAAIVGTTIMIEYLPGRSLKVIVLEGSLRLSNNRLGEALLITAGKMVIMKPDAKRIPDPVDVDLAKLARTSSLIDPDGFRGGTNIAVAPLPSMPLIEREIAAQQRLKDTRGLVDTNLFILGNGTRVVALSDPAAVLNPRTAIPSAPATLVKPALVASVSTPVDAALPVPARVRDTIDRTLTRVAATTTQPGNAWTPTSAPLASSPTALAATNTLLSATSAGSTPVTALAGGTLTSILPVVEMLSPTGNLLVSAVPSLLGGKVDLLAATSAPLDITTGVSDILTATIDSLGGTGVLGTGDLLANITGVLDLTSGVSFLGGRADLFQSAPYNVGAIDLLSSPLGLAGTSLPLSASVAVPSTDLVTATTTAATGATTLLSGSSDTALGTLGTLGGGSTNLVTPAVGSAIVGTDSVSATPSAIPGSSAGSAVVATLDTVTASPTAILGGSGSSPVVATLDSVSAIPSATLGGTNGGSLAAALDTVTAAPSAILGSVAPTAAALPTDSSPVTPAPVASVSTATTPIPVTEPVSTVSSTVTTAPTDILGAATAPLASSSTPAAVPAPTQTTSAPAPTTFTVSSSNQILSLLAAAPISSGGTIKFESAGPDIVVNGQTLKADPGGAVDIRHTGPAGAITLTNATLRGDVVKVGALGTDGRLIIGGGSIDANSVIKLYASGSNGEVRFVDSVSLTGLSVKTIAGSTVTIDNGKIVSIGGIRPANVFTDRPNYSGSGGNGSTSGKFGGAGATTKPFANAPGF